MRHLLCLMLIWANLSATSASALSPSTGFVIVSRGGVNALAVKSAYTGGAFGGSPVAAGALGSLVGWPMTGVMGGALGWAIGLEGKAAVSTAVGTAAAAGDVAALLRSVKADYFLIDTVTGCIYGMVGGAAGGAKGGAVGAWKLADSMGDHLGGSDAGKFLANVVAAVATGTVTGAAAGCFLGGEYGGQTGGKVGTVVAGLARVLDVAAQCLVDAIGGKSCVEAMMDAYEEGGQTGAETGRKWEEWAKKTYH